jgi:transposase
MRTDNQLTFTTYEASLKIKANDPIKVIFDHVDWSFIHPLVKDKYSSLTQGADGYDPISLFKAQLLIYLGEVKSDRKLVEALRYNGRLCLLCGFNFLKTPSNGTFSIFRDRLGESIFYEILHNLIAQAIVLKVIQGKDTAIDSTHVWAYANQAGHKTCQCKGKCKCPKTYSDTDARWGAKNKDYFFFGYKVHLIVDAKSQLPLEIIVTSGEKADSPQAKPLMKSALKKHPQIKIETVSMDSAYDDYKNYNFAVREAHITPLIALNLRTRVNMQSLRSLNLAPDGSYRCIGDFKMVYYGFDKKRSRLKYRCPAAVGKCECPLRWDCSKSAYGRIIYLKPDDDFRLIGTIPRGTALWDKKFDKRTSVERAYSEEKGSHKLNDVRVRGLSKVRIHAYLSICAHILKRIGSAISQGLVKPEPLAYSLSS